MSLKRINHGNENHTPGFVEDTGDTMTGDLIVGNIEISTSSGRIRSSTSLYLGWNGANKLLLRAASGYSSMPTIDTNLLIYPLQKTTALAPTYVKGGMYFDTTLNKLMIGGATDWETVTSS